MVALQGYQNNPHKQGTALMFIVSVVPCFLGINQFRKNDLLDNSLVHLDLFPLPDGHYFASLFGNADKALYRGTYEGKGRLYVNCGN